MAKSVEISVRWYRFGNRGIEDASSHKDADALALGTNNINIANKVQQKIAVHPGWERTTVRLSRSGNSYNIFKSGFRGNDTITIEEDD